MKNNYESVFQVIGDQPVVDQFDILYTALLSGSYVDNYVTGSLIKRVKFGNTFITTQGERRLAFNRLGTNRNKFPGIDTSYELQSWGERSGFVRNLKIFSSNERYKDSQVPDIREIITILGGGLTSFPTFNLISIGLSGSSQGSTAFGFQETFPFEKKFSDIQRIQKIEKIFDNKPIVIAEEGEAYGRWFDSSLPILFLKERDIGHILFGFGDRRKIINTAPTGSQSNLPDKRETSSPFGSPVFVGPMIRGWKYGLINAMPYYNSVIFRRDRFGQFRDMLEQRMSIVSVDDQPNSPMNYLGDTETPAISVVPYPPIKVSQQNQLFLPEVAYDSVVTVQFLQQTIINGEIVYKPANPSNTQSSNLTKLATSEKPFFETGIEVPKANAGYYQEISMLPDILNNQVIGGISEGSLNVGGINVGG